MQDDPTRAVDINWTRPMLTRFRTAFNEEILKGRGRDDVFVWDGHEFLMAYAAYLIEYLDSHLAGRVE